MINIIYNKKIRKNVNVSVEKIKNLKEKGLKPLRIITI